MGRNLIRLSDTAQTLHDWLCLSCRGDSLEVNFEHFRAWIEQHTGKPYSLAQIREAIDELENYQLIEVKSLKLMPKEIDPDRFDLS